MISTLPLASHEGDLLISNMMVIQLLVLYIVILHAKQVPSLK